MSNTLSKDIHDRQKAGKTCQNSSVDGEATEESTLLDPSRGAEGHSETNDASPTGNIDKNRSTSKY